MTYREEFVSRIWIATIVLAVIGLTGAALRAQYLGDWDAFKIHFLFGILLVCVFIFKHHIRLNFQIWLLYGLLMSTGMVGLVSFGVFGNGLYWLLASTFFISFLFPKHSITFYLIFIISLTLSCYFFFDSIDSINLEIVNLFSKPRTWVGILLPVAAFNFIFLIAITSLYNKLKELIKTTESQKIAIEKLANYDELTGNATLRLAKEKLAEAIEHAKKNGTLVGVIYLDLDGFKAINDNHGHSAGDAVLKEVSANIRNILRSSDTVCRIGGDEFFIIIKELTDISHLKQISAKVLNKVNNPIQYQDLELQVSGSLGLATFPDDGDIFDRLISVSDTNMYTAKKNGKNNYYPR